MGSRHAVVPPHSNLPCRSRSGIRLAERQRPMAYLLRGQHEAIVGNRSRLADRHGFRQGGEISRKIPTRDLRPRLDFRHHVRHPSHTGRPWLSGRTRGIHLRERPATHGRRGRQGWRSVFSNGRAPRGVRDVACDLHREGTRHAGGIPREATRPDGRGRCECVVRK